MVARRIFRASMLAVGALLLCALSLPAQDNNTYVQHAVRFAVSPPLRELAKLPQSPQYGFYQANPVGRIPKRSLGPVVDSVEQRKISASGVAYSIGANLLGVGNGFPNYTVSDAPPDTNMAVGDTQILQWVNVSYTVCQKTSPYTCGPAIEGNTLWSSLGGICATNNDGDIIAQWDVRAHRWLLAQNVFTGTYGVCLAVSTSNDATGSYYLYEFPVVNSGFPDYPKWGVWVNNYGQTWNNFGPARSGFVGPVLCAYNNAKLLAGDKTAEQICHQYTSSERTACCPPIIDSPTLPPGGEDQFAIGSLGDVDNSHLSVYSAHINNPNDWAQGATFTGDDNSQLVTISPFTPACNGSYAGDCVPQKGVTDLLDSLGDRLMYRFVFYEDGAAQHWYVNFNVTASSGQNGVRWMELTAPLGPVGPTGISTFQEGTYAPDGNWRWMGSMARDQSNDVLLGYSESNSDMYPSIFIAGRTLSDPPGTLEGEVAVVNGTGSQTDTSNRWGDYSAMRIDPVDNCTFWYTTEYYMVTQKFDWSTQIASARFLGCPQPPVVALQFVPVTPCRLVDTRNPAGEFGGPPLQGGAVRSFTIPDNKSCNIPSSAAAYSLNVTVVPDGTLGYLTVWPTGQQQPLVSTLNSIDGRTKADAAIVRAGTRGGVSFYVTDTTNLVLDIDGYFAPVSKSTLAFYPLPPCRVADTRDPNEPAGLGPPYLSAKVDRDFPVLAATSCSIPSSAQAYSLNFTAVPHGALGYLTVWPTGQSQPNVSTLNAPTGTPTANAAIVPAGQSGEISTFAYNDTDLIIDIDGYFAAPRQGGLSLYPAVPCRVLDTRPPSGNGAFTGTLSPAVDVLGSPCGVPSQSQAYVFNATVVPVGSMGYLTLWADGGQQPYVSTLNAYDGAITSNMAIVPAGTSGKVDAYADGLTNLILDISSYFAP